jgi:hypothetical protein|tara:strand:- start:3268 stop:5346 length:2079 start_codon:yes stop_codon:yes gene_type:complete
MPEQDLTFDPGPGMPDSEDRLNENVGEWKATDDEQKKLIRILNRVEQEMLPARQQFEDEWEDADSTYEAYVTPVENRPNLRFPLSHMVIDAAMAEEVDAFPDIEFEAVEDEDKQKIPILNSLKDHLLDRSNWEKIKIKARRICRIYGWCVVRVYYAKETRILQERIPLKGDEGVQIGIKEVTDHPKDDVVLEVIDDPHRFLIDDSAHDLDEDTEDCALITELSWNKFRQKVQNDKRFINTKYVKPGLVYDVDYDKGEVVPPSQDIGPDFTQKVKLLEYWNKFTDEYVMIANGIIIRNVPLVDDHKELPFAAMHMYRRPHSFYSKGVPKLIESVEAAYNKLVNAAVQATGLSFPMLFLGEDSGIDPQALAPYPGVVLENALGKAELGQLTQVPAEVWQLKSELETILIWLTGVNYQQIFSPEGQSERVGVEALKKESMMSRVNFNLRENESDFVVRTGQIMIQDGQQYYSTPFVVAITDADEVKHLKNKDIIRDEHLVPKGYFQYRKIPIKAGVKFEEKYDEGKALFSLVAKKSDDNSYILGRPEYIRTKGRLNVRPVRPSAMGSSKEAKKLLFAEIINLALDVNGFMAQAGAETGPDGQPIPGQGVWDIAALSKMYAEVNELPVKKVIMDEQDEQEESMAMQSATRIANATTLPFKEQSMEFNEEPNPFADELAQGQFTPEEAQEFNAQTVG